MKLPRIRTRPAFRREITNKRRCARFRVLATVNAHHPRQFVDAMISLFVRSADSYRCYIGGREAGDGAQLLSFRRSSPFTSSSKPRVPACESSTPALSAKRTHRAICSPTCFNLPTTSLTTSSPYTSTSRLLSTHTNHERTQDHDCARRRRRRRSARALPPVRQHPPMPAISAHPCTRSIFARDTSFSRTLATRAPFGSVLPSSLPPSSSSIPTDPSEQPIRRLPRRRRRPRPLRPARGHARPTGGCGWSSDGHGWPTGGNGWPASRYARSAAGSAAGWRGGRAACGCAAVRVRRRGWCAWRASGGVSGGCFCWASGRRRAAQCACCTRCTVRRLRANGRRCTHRTCRPTDRPIYHRPLDRRVHRRPIDRPLHRRPISWRRALQPRRIKAHVRPPSSSFLFLSFRPLHPLDSLRRLPVRRRHEWRRRRRRR